MLQVRQPRLSGILHCTQCAGSVMSGLDPGHRKLFPFQLLGTAKWWGPGDTTKPGSIS